MKRSNIFMDAVYAAIADEAIPRITGFGNGVDRRGNAFIDEMIGQYPVLHKYMEDPTLRLNAFTRYNAAV